MSTPNPAEGAPDQEVADWVETQPRQLTFSELAAACLDRFGAGRAWDAERLRGYWESVHSVPPRWSIERDAELLAFLRDRVGRLTIDEMRAQCTATFPGRWIPSRSALHRWIKRERGHRDADKRGRRGHPRI